MSLCEEGLEFDGENCMRTGGRGVHRCFVGLTGRDSSTQHPVCFLPNQPEFRAEESVSSGGEGELSSGYLERVWAGVYLRRLSVNFTQSRDKSPPRRNIPFKREMLPFLNQGLLIVK